MLTPHPLYIALGASDRLQRQAYRDLFCQAIAQDDLDMLRVSINGG